MGLPDLLTLGWVSEFPSLTAVGLGRGLYLPLRWSRFRVDRVNPAAARQTLKKFWWPPGRLHSIFGGRYSDPRVFLAAAILTLESFWGRVVLACYTGGCILHLKAFEVEIITLCSKEVESFMILVW
ncbi:hypothetical protein PoB_002817200 [Plakobranchus ocellatus]|uniref:Uncharacterized protein n=1 Tax=Plakobranchus ocellatus TaxID=259542 RepID=A0AAV4A454_9GAST|nr:hypothetical protein PoB_002817200 [Plakobranchus ocellatus]